VWHAFVMVKPGYDPVAYEGEEVSKVLVLNAGPGTIQARAWKTVPSKRNISPDLELELRAGSQRVVAGRLVAFHADDNEPAAAGWAIIG